jgi:calcium-dependent protein kinase
LYIVMEYLRGGDLFSFLEKRKFRVREEIAKHIAHQVATALYYLHSFGIVHRDMKPENILMVTTDEMSSVKIVDFGLSKTFGPGENCKEPFGTLCYVAPEILLQKPYDKSVDLWSLGVIIHLMLSGTLPFDSDDDREIARKTIYEEVALAHPVWEAEISNEAKDMVRSKEIFNIIIILYRAPHEKQSRPHKVGVSP